MRKNDGQKKEYSMIGYLKLQRKRTVSIYQGHYL